MHDAMYGKGKINSGTIPSDTLLITPNLQAIA